MSGNLFSYIFRHSMRQQLIALFATLAYLPVLYLSFELPKLIVNEALDANPDAFPRTVFGISFDQVGFLFLLCAAFLGLVVLAGGMRYFLSVYKGVLGEVMLRRLRYDLYTRILQFPLSYLEKVRAGEIVTMATAEAEPIGRYMGVAVANPALLGGTLLTALVFLFAQDLYLGLAACALFPIQAFIVPFIQKKMNAESRSRLSELRQFAGHISETIDGARDIHTHDTSAYELSRASYRLGVLFHIRRRLYQLGNGIIFLNSFFTQLTPFFFYAIGGYLVIMGDLSLGALVAAIAAFREAADPWNDLLEYYQSLEDNRVKFALLAQNFMPEGLRTLPPSERDGAPPKPLDLDGKLDIARLTLRDGEESVLENITFSSPLPARVAIVGPAASGKSELAEILCALRPASSGQISYGSHTLNGLEEPDFGRHMAYLDARSHVFTGSWWDNIAYGFKHQPLPGSGLNGANGNALRISEARLAGNTINDANAEWIMPSEAGATDIKALRDEALRLIDIVGLDDDMFDLGMRAAFNPDDRPDLADGLLEVRAAVHKRLLDEGLDDSVERFHAERFVANATVGENFLLGRPTDMDFHVSGIASQPYAIEILKRHELFEELLHVGYSAARHMVELFKDVSTDDERLARFNLFDQSELPQYEAIMLHARGGDPSGLPATEKAKLYTLAFSLTPAHQRLDILDEGICKRIVAARKDFIREFPDELTGKVEFFANDLVNANVTVRCNILYGRLDRRLMPQHERVGEIVEEEVRAVELKRAICGLGLNASVGTAGVRLATEQRQKLCLVRCLLKKPKLLIVNEGLNTLEGEEADSLREKVLAEMSGGSVIWVDRSADQLKGFDEILTLRNGRLVSTDKNVSEDDLMAADSEGGGGYGRTVQLLDETALLKGVDRQTLSMLSYAGEQIILKADHVLFRTGDDLDAAYVLLSGEVDTFMIEGDNHKVLRRHNPGVVLGAMALLSDIPTPICAKAVGDVELLRLSQELLMDVMAKDPQFTIAIMRHMSERMVEAVGALRAFDTSDAAKQAGAQESA